MVEMNNNINWTVQYKIVKFDEIAGQIQVKCENYDPIINIDLPVDNGKFPEGEALDLYIRGFVPTWLINRSNNVKKVINKDYIKSLISEPEEVKPKFSVPELYAKRHMLLMESDWTQLPDSPLDEDQKKMWRKYRQELRDITSKMGPNMKWPEKPSILSIFKFIN
jgi:hypothetical protein